MFATWKAALPGRRQPRTASGSAGSLPAWWARTLKSVKNSPLPGCAARQSGVAIEWLGKSNPPYCMFRRR